MSIFDRVQRVWKSCFHADRHTMVLDSRQLHAVWEQAHLTELFAFLDVDSVFDIGANRGQYAERLRKKTGYKGYIFSFEPNPHAATIARTRAQGDDKWIVTEGAISDSDGTAEFNVMRSSVFSSLSTPNHVGVGYFTSQNEVTETITVRTERLETALRRLRSEYSFQRSFLKLDTQGYDVKIIKGASDIVRDFVGLQSELAIEKLYADSTDFREAITEYERCGFSLSAFVPNNAGHFPLLLEMDCIMVRSDLADRTRLFRKRSQR